MAIFGKLFGRAARQAARDPRVQAKASAFVEREVAPRAHAAGRKTRDAYEALRDDWRGSAEGESQAGQARPGEAQASESPAGGAQAGEGPEAAARRAGRFLGKLHNRLNQDPGR